MRGIYRFVWIFISIIGLTGCWGDPLSAFVLPISLEVNRTSAIAPGSIILIATDNEIIKPNSKSVSFYNLGNLIGTDSEAPFELTWNIVPGEQGVPFTGNGTLELSAIGDETNRSNPIEIPVTIAQQ